MLKPIGPALADVVAKAKPVEEFLASATPRDIDAMAGLLERIDALTVKLPHPNNVRRK